MPCIWLQDALPLAVTQFDLATAVNWLPLILCLYRCKLQRRQSSQPCWLFEQRLVS